MPSSKNTESPALAGNSEQAVASTLAPASQSAIDGCKSEPSASLASSVDPVRRRPRKKLLIAVAAALLVAWAGSSSRSATRMEMKAKSSCPMARRSRSKEAARGTKRRRPKLRNAILLIRGTASGYRRILRHQLSSRRRGTCCNQAPLGRERAPPLQVVDERTSQATAAPVDDPKTSRLSLQSCGGIASWDS